MIDSFRGQYRFLSNFEASTVRFEDKLYPTVENAYQAAKTLDITAREPFENMTAGEAKRAGRYLELRPDWNNCKYTIMYNLVLQKFKNHEILKAKLLQTGNEELVEGNNWGDTYWGSCQGVGQNNLGKILMQVREELI